MKAAGTFTAGAVGRMHALEGTPLASFWRRAAAFSVDFIVAALGFALIVAAASWAAVLAGWLKPNPGTDFTFSLGNWYTIAALTVYHGVSNYLWEGQTIGKRLLRIRVVSTLCERLTLLQCLRRALAYAVSTLELGLGFAQYFMAENHQTTHDRIVGTVVVHAGARPHRPRPPAS